VKYLKKFEPVYSENTPLGGLPSGRGFMGCGGRGGTYVQ